MTWIRSLSLVEVVGVGTRSSEEQSDSGSFGRSPILRATEGFNPTENFALYVKPCNGLFRESYQKAEKSVGAAGKQGPKVGLWGWVQADLKFPCQGPQLCLDQRPESHNSPGTQNLLSETLCLLAAAACLGVQPLGSSTSSLVPAHNLKPRFQTTTQEKPGLGAGKGAFCCHLQTQCVTRSNHSPRPPASPAPHPEAGAQASLIALPIAAGTSGVAVRRRSAKPCTNTSWS